MYADELAKKPGGLFRLKVVLADAFPDDDQAEIRAGYENPATGEPYFVVLRELRSSELVAYMEVPDKDKFKSLESGLQAYIIEHNLVNSKGEAVALEMVTEVIRQSGAVLYHVLSVWQQSLPLLRRMRKESAGSPPS